MMSLLPPELSAIAVDLSVKAGSREFSFPIRHAHTVLEAVLATGLVLLGGDLWGVDSDGYFATGESWFVNPIEGEDTVDHTRRVRSTAGEFFDLYSGADDKWVTFVVK